MTLNRPFIANRHIFCIGIALQDAETYQKSSSEDFTRPPPLRDGKYKKFNGIGYD